MQVQAVAPVTSELRGQPSMATADSSASTAVNSGVNDHAIHGDPHCDDLDAHSQSCAVLLKGAGIAIGSVFDTRMDARSALAGTLRSKYVDLRLEHMRIVCSRSGKARPKKEKENGGKARKGNSLKCDCPFVVKLRKCVTTGATITPDVPDVALPTRTRAKVHNGPVSIESMQLRHNHVSCVAQSTLLKRSRGGYDSELLGAGLRLQQINASHSQFRMLLESTSNWDPLDSTAQAIVNFKLAVKRYAGDPAVQNAIHENETSFFLSKTLQQKHNTHKPTFNTHTYTNPHSKHTHTHTHALLH